MKLIYVYIWNLLVIRLLVPLEESVSISTVSQSTLHIKIAVKMISGWWRYNNEVSTYKVEKKNTFRLFTFKALCNKFQITAAWRKINLCSLHKTLSYIVLTRQRCSCQFLKRRSLLFCHGGIEILKETRFMQMWEVYKSLE